jgi:hypothetical protein
LKAYARISLTALFSLLVAGVLRYLPTAGSAEDSSAGISTHYEQQHPTSFVVNHTAGRHGAPLNSTTEQRTIEEVVEDISENQHDNSGLVHALGHLLLRSTFSEKGNCQETINQAQSRQPFYILYHSWKSFLE